MSTPTRYIPRLSWLRAHAWPIAVGLLAAQVAVPLLVVFSGWLQVESQIWQHLSENVLGTLLLNTLLLLMGVAAGVFVIGVGLAWLTSMCDFPGRRLFDWALMLPLAIPAYVLAFVALGLLDFSGPVQGMLRAWFGVGNYWFPPIRSTGGVIAVMVLVLYPYVYMLARASFLTLGQGCLEAARVLGRGPWASFFTVALPMARPAIVAGIALALMETLADFGTVAVFNYDTFTTAIYKAWFGLFSLQAASQLASLLLLVVAATLLMEQRLRGRSRFHETSRSGRGHRRRLRGWQAAGAIAAASSVLLLAFVLPVGQLLVWSWQIVGDELDARYLALLGHTLVLGVCAAVLTVIGALILGLARRLHDARIIPALARIAVLGYALPGSVLAVGVMLTLTGIDNFLNTLAKTLGMDAPGQVLGGSVIALLLAYLVRFLAVANGPLESGLARIRPSIGEAARALGAGTGEQITRIYLPLLRPGLFTATLLVLVDVMKEMPATLLLRPFGWDTFAVRIYEMTSEGEWERAALPAISLVLVGLLPIILLVRRSAKGYA